jgi:hypothetical protein
MPDPQPGESVRPASALVEQRPELLGVSGTVDEREGDEAIITWKGVPKRYRVHATLLEEGP